MLSAADVPAERITEFLTQLYGVIPLHRGSYDRAALENALDVLKQNGIVGLFPEGGVWEEGKKKALPGIAWLSYKSGAPVLPIGFSDTIGVIDKALKFKRPKVTMRIGQLIEATKVPLNRPRKHYFHEYADRVMNVVHSLVPLDLSITEPEIVNERFDLQITVRSSSGEEIPIPRKYQILEDIALAKLLHRPAILKIFTVNLDLPVDPLQQLSSNPSIADLKKACQTILDYLNQDNPFLLTYRFGIKGGLAMQQGLLELNRLLEWCQEFDYSISILPIRIYHSLIEDREIMQVDQGSFQSWM